MLFFGLLCLFLGPRLFPQESPSPEAAAAKTLEEQRLDTIRYGTEMEIAALIRTLQGENAFSLDDDLAALAGTTKNRSILAGMFAFFGDRAKGGLEERALQAVENWDEEAGETVLAAVDYLGKLGVREALGPLKALLETGEASFKNSVFRALGRVGKGDQAPDMAEYLIDYYNNRNPADENRREIVSALGELESPAGVSFLAELAGNDEERPVLRIAALEGLSKIGSDDGLDAVMGALAASDPNVRSSAVAALGPFSGEEVDKAILEAFRDSYYRTRAGAAKAAGERKLSAAIPYLRYRAERDETPAVKDEAIRALGAINSRETTAILGDLLGNRKNPDRVRLLAAELLIRDHADDYAQPVIIEMDEAKSKNLTALYNGFLRALGSGRTGALEDLARRLFSSGGVVEKSYALDLTANNRYLSLIPQVRELTDEKNGSLSHKAREVLKGLE
jgi:HEAT repeat protein